MTWFSRLRNWTTDQANGIGIRADYHDSEDDNFASGINNSLNIAGGNSPTSNIAMGGYKFTGAGDGTAASDYATLKQAQLNTTSYAVDSSGSDAYAITLAPAVTAYTTGMVVRFYPGTSNTGAASLNVNALGAKTIKKDKNTDLADGDIIVGQLIEVIYDGTNFQMLSPTYGLIAQNQSSIYAADAGGSDSYAITLAPALTSYVTGIVIRFKANTANTGAASLNVNALGAKTIKKDQGLDLITGDILANQIIQVIYDGTNFQMLSPPSYLISQNQSSIYAADAGGSDSYAITLSPVPAAYVTGMTVRFKANTANTGAASLNVNALGAITIKKFGSTNDLATGDILANQIIQVIYDGTNFQLLSAVDDINNLTQDSTPDPTADFIKTWDASATTYKKALPKDIVPAGSILQVVQGTLTATASSSSSTMADTGLSIAITPVSTSNKVMVMAYVSSGCNGSGANNAAYLNLVRTATVLLQGDAASNRARVTASEGVPASVLATNAATLIYLDSPSTTSATTYKVQFAASNNAATVYINRSVTDTDATSVGRTGSCIIAMEVKG